MELFEEKLAAIDALITAEEQRGPVLGIADIEVRCAALATIDRQMGMRLRGVNIYHFEEIVNRLQAFSERITRLPPIPRIDDIWWAQNHLQLPNLVFLETDMQGSVRYGDAEVIRILAMGKTGGVLFDRFIKPLTPLSIWSIYNTGVTAADLAGAPTAPQIWPELLAALSGRYLIAADVKRTSSLLTRTAMLRLLVGMAHGFPYGETPAAQGDEDGATSRAAPREEMSDAPTD